MVKQRLTECFLARRLNVSVLWHGTMLQCGADIRSLTIEKVDALVEKLKASGKRSTYMKAVTENA